MNGDTTAGAVSIGLMLVLATSALVARRLPLAQTGKLVLAWAGIFAVLYMGFLYRDAFTGVGDRIMGDLRPDAPRRSGAALVITQGSDGHFWVRGEVDGVSTRFLIDSGATTTALSAATVRAAGLVEQGGPGGIVETANGMISVRRVTIGQLRLGDLVRQDLGAVTAPAFGQTNVLGMNFLSTLSRWSVEGRTLTLQP